MKSIWVKGDDGQLLFNIQNDNNAKAELIRAIETYPHDLDWLDLLLNVVTHLSSPSENPLTTQWPENPPVLLDGYSYPESVAQAAAKQVQE